MEFVAFVGTDKENWGQIKALMNRVECEKIILVKNKDSEEFPVEDKTKIIKVDCSKPITQLKEEILESLRKELSGDFEVYLSLASGNGKEHMAVISALLNLPVGIKLVVYTKEGIQFLS